nr:helix-turn-helix domain-containing protein [Palleronia rufa]
MGFDIPGLIPAMEAELGVETCRTRRVRHAGQRVDLPRTDRARPDDPHATAILWLSDRPGFGQLFVPLGPARRNIRAARAVLRTSRNGHSTDRIASALGIDTRTVTRYRARLRAHGHDLTPTTDRTPRRSSTARTSTSPSRASRPSIPTPTPRPPSPGTRSP